MLLVVKNILLYLLLLLGFIALALLKVHWAWILGLVLVAILLDLLNKRKQKKLTFNWLQWFLLFVLVVGTALFARPDKHVSVRGTLFREGLRYSAKLASDPKILFPERIPEIPWTAPKGFQVETLELENSHVELITHEGVTSEYAVYLMHGGGYLTRLSNIYRNLGVFYARGLHQPDVAVLDYRVVPADPYPAALDDAWQGYHALLEKGYAADNIVLAGDSAGGNLALILVQKLKAENQPLPGGLVLMSPWVDFSHSGPSYQFNQANDPSIGAAANPAMGEHLDTYRRLSGLDAHDPRLSPVFGDLSGFPPLLIQVGGYEVMLSEAELLHENATLAGAESHLQVYPGMFHVFPILTRGVTPEADQAWKSVQEFLNKVWE